MLRALNYKAFGNAALTPCKMLHTVKTLYNDAGRTADHIVIPMVLLYIESRVRLISKKKEAEYPKRA